MTIESSKVKTGVFWNIEDCPIPDGVDPHQVYQTIKSGLENEGYRGDVSILAYSDKTSIVDDLFFYYHDAGIMLRNRVTGQIAKVDQMLVDILLFGVDNPAPSNVMVISKNILEETELFGLLQDLKVENFNILLAQPEEAETEEAESAVLLRTVSLVWLWPSQAGLMMEEVKIKAEETEVTSRSLKADSED